MDSTIQELLAAGVAPATATAYRTGVRRYLHFCHMTGLSPFPLVERTLCRFVAHLFECHLAPNSIRLYPSALRFSQISQGRGDPAINTLSQLHYVLRGISRSRPQGNQPRRLPITVEILNILFRAWSATPPHHNTTMLWAACTLSFFAFLRAGEFTVVQGGAHPVLSASDITVDNRFAPTYTTVTLYTRQQNRPIRNWMHPAPRPLTYAHLSSDCSTSFHGNQATYSRPYFYLGRRHSTYSARPGDRSTHSTRWLKRGHHSLHRPQLSDRSGDCSSPSGASRLSHSDAWALAFFSIPALHPHTHVHPPVCIAHIASPPV